MVTEEPINIAALKDFASRRAADTLVLSGCAATVRECIFYFLKCARRVSDELGVLTVVWHEASSFQDHGIATRRYSGVREEELASLPAISTRPTHTSGANCLATPTRANSASTCTSAKPSCNLSWRS